ncbi:MAG: hypothetical protein LUE98_00750 [Tannerellaceae bacterium]|nr:hypothetical protein [Tannerellaceae bacterium]
MKNIIRIVTSAIIAFNCFSVQAESKEIVNPYMNNRYPLIQNLTWSYRSELFNRKDG